MPEVRQNAHRENLKGKASPIAGEAFLWPLTPRRVGLRPSGKNRTAGRGHLRLLTIDKRGKVKYHRAYLLLNRGSSGMKYVKQFGVILLISLVGELLNYLLPLPVPASIYGLILMLLGLRLRVVQLADVTDTAHFLIEIMPLMFIPAAVGLMASWDAIRAKLTAYLVIAAVTTFAVMIVSGRVTQFLLRRGKKEA